MRIGNSECSQKWTNADGKIRLIEAMWIWSEAGAIRKIQMHKDGVHKGKDSGMFRSESWRIQNLRSLLRQGPLLF